MSKDVLDFFDACVAEYPEPKVVANWVMGELTRLLNQNNLEIKDSKITPSSLAQMLKLLEKGTISGKIAKVVFEDMFTTGDSPDKIVKDRGLVQISDEGVLQAIVEEVVAKNPKVVEDFRNGKRKALGFLVGQVMKISKGKANPEIVNRLLQEELSRE